MAPDLCVYACMHCNSIAWVVGRHDMRKRTKQKRLNTGSLPETGAMVDICERRLLSAFSVWVWKHA